MIRTHKTSLHFLKKAPLYLRTEEGKFRVFKKVGVTLEEAGLDLEDLPGKLFLAPEDKLTALQEIQAGLNLVLKDRIEAGELDAVKDTMVELMEETLLEPRTGGLEGIAPMVDTVVAEYAGQPEVLRSLAFLSFKDYTTAMHSVNVMALTLNFCSMQKMALPKTQTLGLAALLHDVGKTQVPGDILTAPRKLSEEEFALMRAHTTNGYNILRKCDFREKAIALAALQHHEKVDGTGYPKGIDDISFVGRIVGIIDCYEAITADERPYRDAMDPFKALHLIGKDVAAGKLDKRLYEAFIQTLT